MGWPEKVVTAEPKISQSRFKLCVWRFLTVRSKNFSINEAEPLKSLFIMDSQNQKGLA